MELCGVREQMKNDVRESVQMKNGRNFCDYCITVPSIPPAGNCFHRRRRRRCITMSQMNNLLPDVM